MQTFKMWILFCVPVNSAKYIFLAVESLYLMFCALYVLTCSQAHFPVKVKQTSGQMLHHVQNSSTLVRTATLREL